MPEHYCRVGGEGWALRVVHGFVAEPGCPQLLAPAEVYRLLKQLGLERACRWSFSQLRRPPGLFVGAKASSSGGGGSGESGEMGPVSLRRKVLPCPDFMDPTLPVYALATILDIPLGPLKPGETPRSLPVPVTYEEYMAQRAAEEEKAKQAARGLPRSRSKEDMAAVAAVVAAPAPSLRPRRERTGSEGEETHEPRREKQPQQEAEAEAEVEGAGPAVGGKKGSKARSAAKLESLASSRPQRKTRKPAAYRDGDEEEEEEEQQQRGAGAGGAKRGGRSQRGGRQRGGRQGKSEAGTVVTSVSSRGRTIRRLVTDRDSDSDESVTSGSRGGRSRGGRGHGRGGRRGRGGGGRGRGKGKEKGKGGRSSRGRGAGKWSRERLSVSSDEEEEGDEAHEGESESEPEPDAGKDTEDSASSESEEGADRDLDFLAGAGEEEDASSAEEDWGEEGEEVVEVELADDPDEHLAATEPRVYELLLRARAQLEGDAAFFNPFLYSNKYRLNAGPEAARADVVALVRGSWRPRFAAPLRPALEIEDASIASRVLAAVKPLPQAGQLPRVEDRRPLAHLEKPKDMLLQLKSQLRGLLVGPWETGTAIVNAWGERVYLARSVQELGRLTALLLELAHPRAFFAGWHVSRACSFSREPTTLHRAPEREPGPLVGATSPVPRLKKPYPSEAEEVGVGRDHEGGSGASPKPKNKRRSRTGLDGLGLDGAAPLIAWCPPRRRSAIRTAGLLKEQADALLRVEEEGEEEEMGGVGSVAGGGGGGNDRRLAVAQAHGAGRWGRWAGCGGAGGGGGGPGRAGRPHLRAGAGRGRAHRCGDHAAAAGRGPRRGEGARPGPGGRAALAPLGGAGTAAAGRAAADGAAAPAQDAEHPPAGVEYPYRSCLHQLPRAAMGHLVAYRAQHARTAAEPEQVLRLVDHCLDHERLQELSHYLGVLRGVRPARHPEYRFHRGGVGGSGGVGARGQPGPAGD